MDRMELIGLLVRSCLGDGQDGAGWEASEAVGASAHLFPPDLQWIPHTLSILAIQKSPVCVGSITSHQSSGTENSEEIAVEVSRRVDYLFSLDDAGQHRGHHATYLEALKLASSRERMANILEETAEAVRRGEIDPSAVSINESTLGGEDGETPVGGFYENLRLRLVNFWEGGPGQFIPTCWPSLNRKLGGGWRRGSLNFVVGRPGGGKTAVAEQDAEFQCANGVRVVYCAIEMEPEDHIARILKRSCYDDLAALGALDFEGQRLSPRQRDKVLECLERVEGLGIRFVSCRSNSAQHIFAALDREWAKCEFDMLILDYFQLIGYDGVGSHSGSALEAMKKSLTQAILPWTRRRNVATILPAQAKRELDDLSITPKKSDISDCSEAEKLASNVVFCHGGKFVVAKARRGTEGSIDVDWVGSRLSFFEQQDVLSI